MLCICLYGSRCSKSFFLGSHFCMQKRIIHSYYIFLHFFFCYQLFKLSFTAYLLSKYLEDNVRNFFICLNLNKKVVLKIIQQRKDLILYHWTVEMFLILKKSCMQINYPLLIYQKFLYIHKEIENKFFFKNTHYKINVILYVSFQNTNFFNTKSQFFSSFSTFKTSEHF